MKVGGQAVIDGVMMKTSNYISTTVRLPNQKLKTQNKKLPNSSFLFKLPFFRGIIQIIDLTAVGMQTMIWSANQQLEEEEQESLSTLKVFGLIAFSFLFSMLVFVFLPLLITKLIITENGVLFNLIDGIIRISFFIIYLTIISLMSDVKILFQYHGAEHKAVNCYENNQDITLENCKKFTRIHARCGTSFLMIVLLVSIGLFSLIKIDNFIIQFGYRILLVPIIAGISYEFMMLASKYQKIFKIFLLPGMLLQKITTREPTDDQIKVAITSLNYVLNYQNEQKHF